MRIEMPNAKQLKSAKIFTDEPLSDLIEGQAQVIKQVCLIITTSSITFYS